MMRFNLTETALNNKSIACYFIIVIFIAGTWSYNRLGRMEDPDFKIRQMIVSAAWPGATAEQMEEQITDKLEKKLQETPHLDYLKSVSRPGQSIIYVNLLDDRPVAEVRPTWLEVRNMVEDIKSQLPQGVYGPFFNDRFDDIYGSIYALTSDEDFSYEEKREVAERIRRLLLEVKSVSKVNLIGVQEETIYIEADSVRLAELGLSVNYLLEAVKARNAVTPAGLVDTSSKNVHLRLTGELDDLEAVRRLPITSGDRTFRLGDIAEVTRAYVEPATETMFFNGQKAIGLTISMEEGGNNLELGRNISAAVARIKSSLPAGLEFHQVVDQPQVVEAAIHDFVNSLKEAVIIVLVVSFISLGLRTGLVVALCIPLVLAGVFLGMDILDIDLHKVSLGSLILSLGLLVDDEIIAVEMMSVKLESGFDRFRAACSAYQVTAIPMLAGTLVTCAGFIPIGFSKGMTAEFTSSIFVVVCLALIISWLVSVMITPLLGYYLIKVKPHDQGHELYSSVFYTKFRRLLTACLHHRGKVITATVALLLLSVYMMTYLKQDFFPASARRELIVNMTLPAASSIKAADREAARLAAWLEREDGIESFSHYVGASAPRFVLSSEPVLPVDNFAQFVIVLNDVKYRKTLMDKIERLFINDFPDAQLNLTVVQTGPPSLYPVMLRVSGYDIKTVKETAHTLAEIMRNDPALYNVNYDWNEKGQSVRLELDHDKLQALGLSKETLALTLQAYISGTQVAEFYEGDKTVAMVLRLGEDDRNYLGDLKDLPIQLPNGAHVPLDQIVSDITLSGEEFSIWRRDLKPTITVSADIRSGTGNDMTKKIYDAAGDLRAKLPLGYSIEIGGSLEVSEKAVASLIGQVPLMFLAMFTILMFQLRKFSLALLALVSALFGLIGVSWTMLAFDQAMGFMAQLGVISLSGMIIRNTIILLDQIKKHEADGEAPWEAIINSAIFRFRPIMLTAAAAIMAMIPLVRSDFWSAMAFAIAGGLVAATLFTLVVIPCLYAVMFKIQPPSAVK